MSGYNIKLFKGLNEVSDPLLLDEAGNSSPFCVNTDVTSGQLRPYSEISKVDNKTIYVTEEYTDEIWKDEDNFGFYEPYFRHKINIGDKDIYIIKLKDKLFLYSLEDNKKAFLGDIDYIIKPYIKASKVEDPPTIYDSNPNFNYPSRSLPRGYKFYNPHYVDYGYAFKGLKFYSDIVNLNFSDEYSLGKAYLCSRFHFGEYLEDIKANTIIPNYEVTSYSYSSHLVSTRYSGFDSSNELFSRLPYGSPYYYFEEHCHRDYDNRFNFGYEITCGLDESIHKRDVIHEILDYKINLNNGDSKFNIAVFPLTRGYIAVVTHEFSVSENSYKDMPHLIEIPPGEEITLDINNSYDGLNNVSRNVNIKNHTNITDSNNMYYYLPHCEISFYDPNDSNVKDVFSQYLNDNAYNVYSFDFTVSPVSDQRGEVAYNKFSKEHFLTCTSKSINAISNNPEIDIKDLCLYFDLSFSSSHGKETVAEQYTIPGYIPRSRLYDRIYDIIYSSEFEFEGHNVSLFVLYSLDIESSTNLDDMYNYNNPKFHAYLVVDQMVNTLFTDKEIINNNSSDIFRFVFNINKNPADVTDSLLLVDYLFYEYDTSNNVFNPLSSLKGYTNISLQAFMYTKPKKLINYLGINTSSKAFRVLSDNLIDATHTYRVLGIETFKVHRLGFFNSAERDENNLLVESDVLEHTSYSKMVCDFVFPRPNFPTHNFNTFDGYCDYINIYVLHNGEVYLKNKLNIPKVIPNNNVKDGDTYHYEYFFGNNYTESVIVSHGWYFAFLYNHNNSTNLKIVKYIGNVELTLEPSGSLVFKDSPNLDNEIESILISSGGEDVINASYWEVCQDCDIIINSINDDAYSIIYPYNFEEDLNTLTEIYEGSFESTITGNTIVYRQIPRDLDGISDQPYAGMSIGWKGKTLYWSETLEPTKWADEFSTIFPYTIMGVIVGSESLTVITTNSTHATTDRNPETLAFYDVANVGALNSKCIVNFQGQPLFMSKQGILLFSGGSYKNLTLNIHSKSYFENASDPMLGATDTEIIYTFDSYNFYKLDLRNIQSTLITFKNYGVGNNALTNLNDCAIPYFLKCSFIDSFNAGKVYLLKEFKFFEEYLKKFNETRKLIHLFKYPNVGSSDYKYSTGFIDNNKLDFQNFSDVFVKGRDDSKIIIYDEFGNPLVGSNKFSSNQIETLRLYIGGNIEPDHFFIFDNLYALNNLVYIDDNFDFTLGYSSPNSLTFKYYGFRFVSGLGNYPIIYLFKYLGGRTFVKDSSTYKVNLGDHAPFDLNGNFRWELWQFTDFIYDSEIQNCSNLPLTYIDNEYWFLNEKSFTGKTSYQNEVHFSKIYLFKNPKGIPVLLRYVSNIFDHLFKPPYPFGPDGSLVPGWVYVNPNVTDIEYIPLDLNTSYGSTIGLPFDVQSDRISVILKGSNVINGLNIKGI